MITWSEYKLSTVCYNHILHVLTLTDGNRTKAAQVLDISIRTLRNKINEMTKLGYSVPNPKDLSIDAFERLKTQSKVRSLYEQL